MIKITVTPIYEIIIDDKNHTLYKKGIAKSGKSKGQETKQILGYFGSVKNCLHEIAKDKITSQEIELFGIEQYKTLIDETFQNFFNELNNVAENIEKIAKPKKQNKEKIVWR